MDTLVTLSTWFDTEFGQPTVVRALVVGLICSIGFTQLVKFSTAFQQLSDRNHRIATRAVSLCFATIPTWILWPTPGIAAFLISVTLGIVAPMIYTIAVRVTVHFFPWLDDQVSARPASDTTNTK